MTVTLSLSRCDSSSYVKVMLRHTPPAGHEGNGRIAQAHHDSIVSALVLGFFSFPKGKIGGGGEGVEGSGNTKPVKKPVESLGGAKSLIDFSSSKN